MGRPNRIGDPDPRKRLRDKRAEAAPQPHDEEPDEDELADEMARLMGSREVSDEE